MARNLNQDLWRTRQGEAPADEHDAPLAPSQPETFEQIAARPVKSRVSDLSKRRTVLRRQPIGACVSAYVIGGRA
jgi:hypothetical protein